MAHEALMEKKGILDWYHRSRIKFYKAFKALSVIMLVVSLLETMVHTDAHFIIGKPGLPFFDDFYETRVDEFMFGVYFYDIFVAAVIVFMFSHIKSCVEGMLAHGVILYNITIATQMFFVVKSLFMGIIMFGRFSILGIIYVPYIICAILIFVLNIRHFKNYEELYKYDVGYRTSLPVLIACICLVVGSSVLVGVITKQDMKEKEEQYIVSECELAIEIFRDSYDDSIKDSISSYIGLWYVNLFNDRGRTYTIEELDEAFYDREISGDKSYYRRENWPVIGEINSDLEAIEKSYDLSSYAYFEEENDYMIFCRLVSHRLSCLGQKNLSMGEITNHDEIEAACQYVYDLITSGKPMEELGTAGEEIKINFSQDIKAGTKGFYAMETDYENTYANVIRWEKVAFVGSDNGIERYYSHTDSSDFTFEDGCVYKAVIEVCPEVTYYFNEDMKALIKDLDGDSYTYSTYDHKISIVAWICVGDEVKYEDTKDIYDVQITGLEGIKAGDDISEACDMSLISFDENLVCHYDWRYYNQSGYMGGYYTDCNPLEDDENSIKEFSLDCPVYQAKFDVYSDTGYKFAEQLNVTYNDKLVGGYMDYNLVPDVKLYGYYVQYEEGLVSVGINFYRIRFEGRHGTITANYDFAPEGTSITLTPVPDEGYKFVGYETSNDLRGNPDMEIEIVDNSFVMADYPVVITGIFEKE